MSDQALTCSETDVDLRGQRIRLCSWGTPDGPCALLLHGWLDQAASWQSVAWRLAERGWYVVAPDHRGHGRSAWAPAGTSYHFTDYIVDLDHLFDLLPRPIEALVGHSMGGTMASIYAGLRPQSIRHLFLLEGLGPAAATPSDSADQLLRHLDDQRNRRAAKTMESVDAAAKRLRRLTPALNAELARALAVRATTTTAAEEVQWIWDPMHRTRAAVAYDTQRHAALLQRITAPTIIVDGDRSWYQSIDGIEERASAIGTIRARHLIHASHSIHIDAPEFLANLIHTTVRDSSSA